MRQLTELKKNPNDSFSVGLGDDGNLFRWEIMIMGPADSLFEGGFFKAEMTFPPDFPNSPPTLKFRIQIFILMEKYVFLYCTHLVKINSIHKRVPKSDGDQF